MKLVIVESPAKKAKIKEYLGPGYDVDSSIGHIRDLPKNGMGFDTTTLKPEYEITSDKKKVVATLLRKAKSADHIIFATDLDREGEAIAYHLRQVLQPASYTRIVFNEITKSAILAAIQAPKDIDMRMVAAQECRRLLDRYFGYTVSPWLKHATGIFNMSAGRVQSVALLLLYERNKAITEHSSERYFELVTHHEDDGLAWKASLNTDGLIPADQEPPHITSETQINHIQNFVMQRGTLTVQSVTESRKRKKPPAPFKTSTLQQAASNALVGFTPKLTMKIAQKLYEAGLITYMRTDVVRLSDDAQSNIRGWLQQWGKAKKIPEPTIPVKPHTFASGADAQEAHEAIRPSDVYNMGHDIQGIDNRQTEQMKALYKLIWLRTVASQMPHYEYDQTVAILASDRDHHTGAPYTFKIAANKPAIQGWRLLLQSDDTRDQPDSNDDQIMPALQEGQSVRIGQAEILAKQTKPPAHYKEAALINKLEKEGVGRPSTFSSIIDTLLKRGYAITNKKKQFAITDLGITAIEAMLHKFSFLDVGFTKAIEVQLDLISKGQAKYSDVLSGQIRQLDQEIDANGGKPPEREKKPPLAVVMKCPTCKSGGLVVRTSKRGEFLSCNRYPKCKHAQDKPAV